MTTDNLSPPIATLRTIIRTSFLVGAIMILVGTLALPTLDLTDVQASQARYGAQAVRLQACALLITVGMWSIMAGTSSVPAVLSAHGALWARLGAQFHGVGVVVWTIGMALDIAYPAAIRTWLVAPPDEQIVAASVVAVLSPVGFGRGLFPLNVMINWLAFGFLGIGLVRSSAGGRRLGWSGIILGSAGFGLGIFMTFVGRERLFLLFAVLWGMTLLWWAALGATTRWMQGTDS
ncbi:hypothetical protein [Herpetosiphon geysericola]|uniref:DUF4386 domain-containing protein n=1 Tax=Herpetosiphon geysericola TaxID=70996 RepID=A0A0P6XKB8_9CHLR|nr:hypothetical protein [Herpetosiphon geysericola]KPL80488.1 hypothetical protein SE18_23790 [Herpetosiphon geysericola]